MIKKGEIWLAEIPSKKGREQEGKRPLIIIADTDTSLALIIPLTSNLLALKKFTYTLLIDKSEENNLNIDSIALIFQLQAIDKNRLIHKIGYLEENYLSEINKILKNLLKL